MTENEIKTMKETIQKYERRLEISPYGDDKIDQLEQSLQFAQNEIAIQKKEIQELKNKILELTNSWLKYGDGERRMYEL